MWYSNIKSRCASLSPPHTTPSFFSDITFRKKAEEELRRLATTDQLTNLPNRNTFQKTVTKAINNSEQYAQHSLLFIDLDNFKRINDSLGHSIGDELLITVAEILQSIVVGSSGLVARLGGDELTIFLENIQNKVQNKFR